ncbi:MerR family transcriptional regulator [Acetivibrio cellulolyticus]|uniref:MerR family transcriptional regulator n=1 Tax=Acetivibrio cellulolyticus TaxID=35830 RepID=UPI0001E2E729|nr:MerR family transcriptional regulator [Acetivibrio cellulolyticus]
MRTVKEVSELTGISIRTLHYYDEINLLKPTECSKSGYRLYDDNALVVLQQILFFREFDMPLKEIKAILEDPILDRNQILQSQKKMLELRKERLERLISSINDILKGETKMDFEVFSKAEIEELYQALISHMPEKVKQAVEREYGGMNEFHEHYMKYAFGEHGQKTYQKMIEWYGDKESALNASINPPDSQTIQSCEKRLDILMKKLSEKTEKNVSSYEVKEVIAEYGFMFKQLYQLKDEKIFMLDMAASYKNDERLNNTLDEKYGVGITDFFVKAIDEFYNK